MVAPGWRTLLEGLVTGDRSNWHPVFDVADLVPVAYGEGSFEFAWTPGPAWLNPGQQTIFGGAAATALECAYGGAMATLIADGEMQAAIRLETDFVRPVRLGTPYRVVGRVTERSGQMMFCRGEITDADGRTAVLGSGVCRVIRPAPTE